MGIKGLETFIHYQRHRISETISIPAQIRKWRNKPTILVDLKEFARIVAQADEEGYILGGRFDSVNELSNHFFGRIKETGANLVFFSALNEGRFKDIEKFVDNNSVFDCIKNVKSLEYFLDEVKDGVWGSSDLRPNERITFNLMTLCKEYGQVFCSYGLTKAHILAYSRQLDHNVKALITRDTEFLVYDVDFEFWSLSNVDFREMKITRFNRDNLYDCMNVNIRQMQLLCALSQFSKDKRARICGATGSMQSLISFVKQQKCGPIGYDVMAFWGNIPTDLLQEISNELEKLVKRDSYAGSWTADQYVEPLSKIIAHQPDFKSVVNFCQNNLYFAYKLMNESMTVQKDLRFIDLRRSDSRRYLDTIASTLLKLCGIAFMGVDAHERPISRSVYLKTDETAEPVERKIIFPPSSLNLPRFENLIFNQNEECEQLNDLRWSLFQWVTGLNAESISRTKLSFDSKHIRLVSFTLNFLFENRLIAECDADLVFQTEIDGQKMTGTKPWLNKKDDRFPEYVDIDWVLIAHKYTIAFELICHCLEMCGLRDETSIIQFNSARFHSEMHAKM